MLVQGAVRLQYLVIDPASLGVLPGGAGADDAWKVGVDRNRESTLPDEPREAPGRMEAVQRDDAPGVGRVPPDFSGLHGHWKPAAGIG